MGLILIINPGKTAAHCYGSPDREFLPMQKQMYGRKYPVHPMSAKQCALSLTNGPCRYLWGWRWLFWVETGDGQVSALEKADGRHCGWKMEQKPGCFPLWDAPLKQIFQLKCCAAQWQFFLGVQSNNKLKMLWKIHSWPLESRAVFGCCIFVKEKWIIFYFFLYKHIACFSFDYPTWFKLSLGALLNCHLSDSFLTKSCVNLL